MFSFDLKKTKNLSYTIINNSSSMIQTFFNHAIFDPNFNFISKIKSLVGLFNKFKLATGNFLYCNVHVVLCTVNVTEVTQKVQEAIKPIKETNSGGTFLLILLGLGVTGYFGYLGYNFLTVLWNTKSWRDLCCNV